MSTLNPYQPPQAAVDHDTHADATVSKLELATFARAAYYERKWAGAAIGNFRLGFNWSAALLGDMWLCYRKMYWLGFTLLLLPTALTLISELIATRAGYPLNHDEALALYFVIAGLIRLALGFFANYLYYRVALFEIAKIDADNLSNEDHLQRIHKAGGGSMAGFAAAWIVNAVLRILTL